MEEEFVLVGGLNMNIQDYIFDEYILCPICKEKFTMLSPAHLKYKHGYEGLRGFKLKHRIPFNVPIVAHHTLKQMRENGKKRSEWFWEHVSPKGIQITKEHYLVPKESRQHAGRIRKGKSWHPSFIQQMREEGWLDLHTAANKLGIAYNYVRKCATDRRLQTVLNKGIRFTTEEWVEETRVLLQKNREKYRPDLL